MTDDLLLEPHTLLAPCPDWNEAGEHGHFAQFYESDAYLLDSLSGFLGAGLRAGSAGVVIATAAHREALDARLLAHGLDVGLLRSEARYVSLDAAETLARFMIDGSPDPKRFHDVIGSTLAQASASGRRVVAFGEMVALLWMQGNLAAASRLEALWNDLRKTHSFSLLCGYPMSGFGKDSDGAPFTEVCTQHSRVIPAESYASLATPDARLRAISVLQQKARSLEAEIATRKKVEQALSRREEELSDFLENAPEGLHQVGSDGIIQWANKAELTLLGYAPHEYIGHHVAEFHVDREVIEDILARLRRNEVLSDHPARLRCKDGSIKHVVIRSNVLWENGEFVHTRCLTRDVTERKHMQEEVERLLASTQAARKDAEAANRAKDVFLATLSHELRTPLNAILGWAVIMRRYRHCESKEVSEGLAAIERSARAQAKLIEDVLDISRIVSGKLHLDARPCELVSVIGAAVDAVRPALEARNIQLKIDLDSDASCIQGDAVRLQQVFWNLLSNAVKFTPKNGTVEVRLARHASAARVSVKDTGKGISPDFLPYVFDRFRQADDGTTRLHGGLGLGLSIVRHVVEMHGGTVAAESAGENCGATFLVDLPIRAIREESEPSQRASEPAAGTGAIGPELTGVHVLVVDDEADALMILRRTLEAAGAVVSSAASASEAMELMRAAPPHVLVSDIGLPGEDDHTLMRAIRAAGRGAKELPAVALTAFASGADKQKALMSGFQVHVAKPVDPDELTAVVASLAGRTGA